MILNGASSSGKTTLATAFRDQQAAVGEFCRRLLHVYHHAVAAAARSGLDVIVDDVVVDEGILDDWLDVLSELQPTWIGVRCSPEVAVEREQRRGDRPVGMTSTQSMSVHRHVRYAFEIDTGDLTPSECLIELTRKLAH